MKYFAILLAFSFVSLAAHAQSTAPYTTIIPTEKQTDSIQTNTKEMTKPKKKEAKDEKKEKE